MTASETCRSCGAVLPAAVPWCGQCLVPVDEPATTPACRAPRSRGILESRAQTPQYSRWQAGPTTFGPVGRVLATILILSFGPWTGVSFFTLLWTPVWVILATVLLRQ